MFSKLFDIFSPAFCLHCQKESNELVCILCLNNIERIQCEPGGILSYGRYEGVLKELIHSFKYENKFGLADLFANLLRDLIPANIDILIPIPLHIQKIRHRKYNQSILLAKALSKRTSIPVFLNILKKTTNTEPQITLSKMERIQNIKNSFNVHNAEKIAGKHILLVDDVYTTGATMKEATRVLQEAGAQEISVLTIAS